MQMKSITRRPFKYAGVLVEPQAEFSVKSARDAKVLSATRRAALMVAPAPVPAAAPQVPAKRSYKRRDMVAETASAPAGVPDMSLLMHVRPADVSPEAWKPPGSAPGFEGIPDDMLPKAVDTEPS